MPRPVPDLPGVEHRFVDVAGLRVHVALAGRGRPLVLLHGWPQNWWQWRHVIPSLAVNRQVICPDLRGLGWTDAPRDGYDPATMAADLVGLLDRLGTGPVDLVGHDWGGAAGYALALRRPDLVRRFVAVNTASPFLGPSPATLALAPRLWHIGANGLGPHFAGSLVPRWALRHWTRNRAAATDEDERIFLDQFDEPARVRATVRYYRTLAGTGIPRTLARHRRGRLTVPTLVLSGDSDPLLPPSRMIGFGPRADVRARFLPRVGHFPATEAPAALVDGMRDFLAA